MRFKLDENLPNAVADELSKSGHDVSTCIDENLGGAIDSEVFIHSEKENRILATFDLDFSDIRQYPPGNHPGIIILRLQSQDIRSCVAAFNKLFSQISEEEIKRNLVIVEETRVRIRRPEDGQ